MRGGTSTTWPSTLRQGGRSHADIHQMVVASVARAVGTSSGEVPTSPAGGTEMETGAMGNEGLPGGTDRLCV